MLMNPHTIALLENVLFLSHPLLVGSFHLTISPEQAVPNNNPPTLPAGEKQTHQLGLIPLSRLQTGPLTVHAYRFLFENKLKRTVAMSRRGNDP